MLNQANRNRRHPDVIGRSAVTEPPSRALSLLQRLSERLLDADVEFRRQHPYRFADKEILFVENVAGMLGCSVDHVRRISRSELPASRGVGRRLLYLREDVIRYVRLHRDAQGNSYRRPEASAPSAQVSAKPVFDAAAAARRVRRKAAG